MKAKTILLALIAVIALATLQTRAAVPSAMLSDLDGKTVDTATLGNEGHPVVLSFFATWCKPCMRELKAISGQYEDWEDETGVEFIAVSIDDAQDADKVRSLVLSNDWPFRVLLDPNEDLRRALGAQLVPYTFIVDGKGNVVYSHAGYNDGDEAHLIDQIREIVNK